MPDVLLPGLTPEPLTAYLGALGVLRIVGEQADPQARGRFTDAGFELHSRFDLDGLLAFLVEEYRPAPVVSPWNGGSGFYENDATARALHDRVLEQDGDRFATLATTIRAGRSVAPERKPEGAKDEAVKRELIQTCRNVFPDEAVRWIDALGVVDNERARFAPLLGTGGNDGRFELSKNYVENLVDVLIDIDRVASTARLRALLMRSGGVRLHKRSPGQFDPGTAPQVGEDALIEPWCFVLAVEGMLLFASAATRRVHDAGAGGGGAAFPFLVQASAGGYGTSTAAELERSSSRDELWLPIWHEAMSAKAIAQVFREARLEWGTRRAGSALEARAALASRGSAWGVDEFARYSLLQRNGLSYSAVPTGRVPARQRPAVGMLDDLRPLAETVRRARSNEELPRSARDAAEAFEHAWFRACDSGRPREMQDLLIAAGRIELLRTRSPKVDAQLFVRPLWLQRRWLNAAGDDSAEWRIAAAVAGMPDMSWNIFGRRDRDPSAASHEQVWTGRDPSMDLRAVLRRRLVHSTERAQFDSPQPASLADVAALLHGVVDVGRIAQLLPALTCVAVRRDHVADARPSGERGRPRSISRDLARALPPAYLLLRPFVQSSEPYSESRAQPFAFDVAPLQVLLAGRVTDALADAARLLRVRGLCNPPSDILVDSTDRSLALLAAALLVPVPDVTSALWRIDPALRTSAEADTHEPTPERNLA